MLTRTVDVQGWTLGFEANDDEPRIRDLDLAERLGFKEVRAIRKLIRSLIRTGKLSDVRVIYAPSRTAGGRPAEEFWLTEAQALKVTAKSETAKADAILDEVIAVYGAWRRGQLSAHRSAALEVTSDALLALSTRVGDNGAACADIRRKLHLVAKATGRTFQAAHGQLRRDFRVSSYKLLPLTHYKLAREQLIAMAECPDLPPAVAAANAANQLDLFDYLKRFGEAS